MTSTKLVLRVVEARRVQHPILPNIEKHSFLVRAKDMPKGIALKPNAREASKFSKRVYQDVRRNLLGEDTKPGYFDLMNKGITIIADQVKRIDDKNYELVLTAEQGIVDGGHTYGIIGNVQDDPRMREEQHVEVNVRVGVPPEMYAEISRGLNTGIQVAQQSLDNLAGHYDWMKLEIDEEPYADKLAWREEDVGEYDVRDLICVLEAFNVFDFPNTGSNHPISAYEKWSIPTAKFAKDAVEHKSNVQGSKYYRLHRLLKDGLRLYDTIRRDFYQVYNAADLGQAGKLKIVEQAKEGTEFSFPFAQLQGAKFRLTKGALFPIMAAFRNMVEVDPQTGEAQWRGGFNAVLELWKEVSPEVARVTKTAIQDIGYQPDALGKNRGHWSNMHKTIELFILRRQMAEVEAQKAAAKPKQKVN